MPTISPWRNFKWSMPVWSPDTADRPVTYFLCTNGLLLVHLLWIYGIYYICCFYVSSVNTFSSQSPIPRGHSQSHCPSTHMSFHGYLKTPGRYSRSSEYTAVSPFSMIKVTCIFPCRIPQLICRKGRFFLLLQRLDLRSQLFFSGCNEMEKKCYFWQFYALA